MEDYSNNNNGSNRYQPYKQSSLGQKIRTPIGGTTAAKPNPGLNLATLSNIPREIKNKLNLTSGGRVLSAGISQSINNNPLASVNQLSVNNNNLTSSKSNNRSLKNSNDLLSKNSYYQRYSEEKETKEKLSQSQNLIPPMSTKRMKSSNSSNFFKPSSNKSQTKHGSSSKYSAIQSPTSNIFKSYGCHRYHTDLDFNYLANEKFFKDSVSCGKDRLSTVALRNSSPDKYNYENKYDALKSSNRYNKSMSSTVNLNNFVTKDHDKDYENQEVFEYYENNNPKNLNNLSHSMNNKSNLKQLEESGLGSHNKKTSQGILSDLLDKQFSVNSPSQLKLFQSEVDHIKNEEFKRNMTSGLLNIKGGIKDNRELTSPLTKSAIRDNKHGNIGTISNVNGEIQQDKIYLDDETNNKLTVNLSYLGENPQDRFIDGLENVLTYLDPIFDRMSLTERIEKFLESTEDPKRSIKLGSVVALYLILRKFHVEDGLKLLILEKCVQLLQNFESQEELFLVAVLEICSLFAPHELLLENISLICMFLTDFNFPRLQKAAFNCLMCMEYEGIKTLIELASKDYQEYQKYILANLLNTPHIQKIIIIRALLNEVYSNVPDRRHSALAALNRMHDLVGDTDALSKLSKFFHESKVEKIFLSSTIRTAGVEGEKILLNELKNNKDFSVRVAIASVLSYRLPKKPKYLDIRLDSNDTYSITKNLPGSFCTYYGKVTPYVYFEKEIEGIDGPNEEKSNPNGEVQEDYLEINTRDFLASLQRMLVMNYDHSNPQIVHSGNPNLLEDLELEKKQNNSEILAKYAVYFEISSNIQGSNAHLEHFETDENGKILISEDVIRALCHCLKDYSTAVRDTAAGSLGQIGLPESLLSIDYLLDSVKDEDVNVKSKIIWAIGRIAPGVDNSVILPVVEALKSNMWKVKSACLFTLSQFGYRCSKMAMPTLNKLLKESAINKQTIAETMVKLGSDGESTLLRVMSSEPDSNYKLKSSIAKALALSNVNSPNIDFIVECLFKTAKVNNPIIRKSALFAIRILAEKSDEKVTYLKKKNVIPFYYEMMFDKEITIQAVRII